MTATRAPNFVLLDRGWSTRAECAACHGYGTRDGKPAPTSTSAALFDDDDGCPVCGGTGDAPETGGGAS